MVHERWLRSMSGFGNGYRLREGSKGLRILVAAKKIGSGMSD